MPELKIDLSTAPMLLEQDDIIEVDQADNKPVVVEKFRPQNAKRAARKADMSAFDREKFYKRLGISQEPSEEQKEEIELLEMQEEICEEMSQDQFADAQEVSLQKQKDLSAMKKPKADMCAFDYEAFCRR